MKDPKDISFVRLNILENWRFWNKYQVKGDFEGAGREVIAQANAMLAQDTESNERAAMLIQMGIEFRMKRQASGRAGGEAKAINARASDETPPPEKPQQPPKRKVLAIKPPTLEQLYDFCYEENLDAEYGREWYEMTVVDRDFKDRNGDPVKDWQKMCKGYIQKKTTK